MSSLARRMPGEIQAKGIGRRPVQAWVSCTWGRATARDPYALGGDQCGEQPVKKRHVARVNFQRTVCSSSQMQEASTVALATSTVERLWRQLVTTPSAKTQFRRWEEAIASSLGKKLEMVLLWASMDPRDVWT